MPALQHFFDAERQRRGWSMKEAAERSRISLSKAYAITNGDDNVEFQTFENIAAAFGMTPADLAVVIGKGSADHDPDETHVLVTFRQIPEHKRDAAKEMLEGLVKPIRSPRPNRPVRPKANRDRATGSEIERNQAQGEDLGPNSGLAPCSPHVLRPGSIARGRLAQAV